MSGGSIAEAARILAGQHGHEPLPLRGTGRWPQVLDVLMGSGGNGRPTPLPETLRTPAVAAMRPLAELRAALQGVPRATQVAGAVQGTARWWLKRFGPVEIAPAVGDTERLRRELIAVRGLGSETVDRLLLHVFDLRVFPVGRAAMRIACRHGWLDPSAEYEEWQSAFLGGIEAEGLPLRGAAEWFARIGRDHCGPAPRCDACPLRPLLPLSGPYEPESGA